MFSKIINFIKYHNAFTIGFMIVFVGFNVSLAASEDLRDNFISSQNNVRSVDNSYVLAVDLDNLNFDLQVKEITENAEKYYVVYNYKTVAIADYVWQDVSVEKTLTVSRAALDGRDLGLYVAEELGENIDYELSYLREAQVLEKEKGLTQKIATTEYAGLVGKFLSPEEKVFPGYEPVVTEPEPEVVAQPEPEVPTGETDTSALPVEQPAQQVAQEPIDRELIRQIVQEMLDQAALDDEQTNDTSPEDDPAQPVCTPIWGCSDWQQSTDLVSCDEVFVQTRICIDNNGCETDENKPTESQSATGTNCPSDSTDDPPVDEDPTCGVENLDLCDESNCADASGYYYDGGCHMEEKPDEPVETATNTPPVIILTQTSIIRTVGDAFDPADHATTTDPDGDTVIQYADSSVDIAVAGIYSVEYTAEDEHGMWAESETLSVIVEEPAEPVCDAENLDLCDESNCELNAGGYYYDGGCHDTCQELTFYIDADADGFGDLNNSISACELPDGYVNNADDCDDNNVNINPNVVEVCGNDIDENCDGVDDNCPDPPE